MPERSKGRSEAGGTVIVSAVALFTSVAGLGRSRECKKGDNLRRHVWRLCGDCKHPESIQERSAGSAMTQNKVIAVVAGADVETNVVEVVDGVAFWWFGASCDRN